MNSFRGVRGHPTRAWLVISACLLAPASIALGQQQPAETVITITATPSPLAQPQTTAPAPASPPLAALPPTASSPSQPAPPPLPHGLDAEWSLGYGNVANTGAGYGAGRLALGGRAAPGVAIGGALEWDASGDGTNRVVFDTFTAFHFGGRKAALFDPTLAIGLGYALWVTPLSNGVTTIVNSALLSYVDMSLRFSLAARITPTMRIGPYLEARELVAVGCTSLTPANFPCSVGSEPALGLGLSMAWVGPF